MKIHVDDLSGPEVVLFLEEHIEEMKLISPPGSKHALDLDGLRAREVTFWVVRDEGALIGCGAMKELDSRHVEIKSMRTQALSRGKGVGGKLLSHIIEEAILRGYNKISLETGSMSFFAPARKLYERFGFLICGPFSNYREDPNSVFMTLEINKRFK